MDPLLGMIVLFAGNFAPRGWAFCNGQLLSIAQNTALFSILGTTYGGDGRTTFALPDLRGRVPLHAGASTGPGLSHRELGERGGSESVALTGAQLPPHQHTLQAAPEANGDPAGGILAAATDEKRGQTVTGVAGGGQPHDNMQPYLGLNYIIALQGIFPSRD